MDYCSSIIHFVELEEETVSTEDELLEISEDKWDDDEPASSAGRLELLCSLIDDEDSDDELACPVGKLASPSDRF